VISILICSFADLAISIDRVLEAGALLESKCSMIGCGKQG